jgi:hypothetical protein
LEAGLALLKLSEPEILKTQDSEQVIQKLRESKVDDQELLKVAFFDYGVLPIDKITEMRNKNKAMTIHSMEETKMKKIAQLSEEMKRAKCKIFLLI